MKCRKCGNPVRETEQRCSVCGARVIKEPLSLSKKRKSTSPMDTDGADDLVFQGYIPPEEQFSWNTDGFPREKKPTKDIQFNWNTFDQFHEGKGEKASYKEGDEIAFGEDLLPGVEADLDEEKVVWNEPFEIPIAPEDVIKTSKESHEVLPKVEAAKVIPEEMLAAEEEQELASAEEPIAGENDVTGQQLEEELFEEIRKEQRSVPTSVSMTDAMAAHTVSTNETDHGQVDQFYTFNRKNEEFQRLLDKEYEKYRSGRGESDLEQEAEEYSSAAYDQDRIEPPETGMPAYLAALIKEQEAESQAVSRFREEKLQEEKTIEGGPEKEEAFEQPGQPEEAEVQKTEEQKPEKQPDKRTPEAVNRKEDAVKSESSLESSMEIPKEEVPERVETKTLPAENSKEEIVAGENTPDKKGKRSRRWVMVILIILLALLVLAATALIAPNSPPGTWLHSILGTSQVEKQEPVPQKTDSTEAAKDKTGIIQLVVKEQKNLSLTKVAYSDKLQYRDDRTYKDKAIKTSKVLEENEKHVDSRGKKIPLDQALVEAAMVYADSHMTPKGKEKELKIGQIRYTDKAYYVWVSENNIKKIYRIDNSKGTLQVSGIVQV